MYPGHSGIEYYCENTKCKNGIYAIVHYKNLKHSSVHLKLQGDETWASGKCKQYHTILFSYFFVTNHGLK